jgi:hypothetical protein
LPPDGSARTFELGARRPSLVDTKCTRTILLAGASGIGQGRVKTHKCGDPVYNGGPFIAECIESVLSQRYARFEYVICDNHSTDATPAVIRFSTDVALLVYSFGTVLAATMLAV